MADKKGMRVTAISGERLLGLEEFRITPGAITRVKGRNGVGKTSALMMVKAALGGGDLAHLQRIDPKTGKPTEEPPEVHLVLDEGALRVEREGKKTTVFQRVGDTAAEKKVAQPATFVEGIYDRTMSDPMVLLTAHPKKRVDWILEVLPLRVSPAQIREAVGDEWETVESVAVEGHPLQVLSAVEKVLFTTRTGVNVSYDDQKNLADSLALNIPANMPDVKGAEGIAEIEKERDAAAVAVDRARAAAETVYREKTTAARTKAEADISTEKEGLRVFTADVNRELEVQIARLRREAAQKVDEKRQEVEADIAHYRKEMDVACNAAHDERDRAIIAVAEDQARLDDLNRKVEAARNAVERNAELRTTKRLHDEATAKAETMKGRAERLSAALDAVRSMKAKLLAALPVDGLSIEGDEIYVNKIPFDQLNTAQRIALAVKVACLRAKQRMLPFICVDGAEALDEEGLEALEAGIIAEGCQAMISIRTEDPELKIERRD